MKLEKAINALKQKQAIISRTDDDHWLYEPIATVLKELETLGNLVKENLKLKDRIKELETENEHLQDRIENLYEMLTAEDEDD